MPQWARYLAATATGGGLALCLTILVAALRDGGPGFWRGLWQFAAHTGFWWTATRFCLLAGLALLLGRAADSYRHHPGERAGWALLYTGLAGAFLGLLWAAFLGASLGLMPWQALPDALVLAAAGATGGLSARLLFARL